MWAVFNVFFTIGSLPLNLVYIGIFGTVQGAFTLVAAAYFVAADGNADLAKRINIAGGAFAFASGMLGYYTLGNLMCQEALGWTFPMGDTSRFFRTNRERLERIATKESVIDSKTVEAGDARGSSKSS